MTMPVTQSIIPPNFTPENFDDFLDEIGFAEADPETRKAFSYRAAELIKLKIFEIVRRRLSDEKLEELVKAFGEKAETSGYQMVNDILAQEIPDITELVEQAIEDVKDELRYAAADLPGTINKFIKLYGDPEDKEALGSADSSTIDEQATHEPISEQEEATNEMATSSDDDMPKASSPEESHRLIEQLRKELWNERKPEKSSEIEPTPAAAATPTPLEPSPQPMPAIELPSSPSINSSLPEMSSSSQGSLGPVSPPPFPWEIPSDTPDDSSKDQSSSQAAITDELASLKNQPNDQDQ